ncbi:hypothetical protein QOT17_005978 [Balamuthia mandrillaris]
MAEEEQPPPHWKEGEEEEEEEDGYEAANTNRRWQQLQEQLPFLRPEKGLTPHRGRDVAHLWAGYLLLLATFLYFVVSLYWVVASKWMPWTGVPLLDWMKEDRYYGLLVQATIPATLVLVVPNFFSFNVPSLQKALDLGQVLLLLVLLEVQRDPLPRPLPGPLVVFQGMIARPQQQLVQLLGIASVGLPQLRL